MSIYVTDFSGTSWACVHDDALGGAHTGTVDPTTVVHTKNLDGTDNHDFLVVVCPVCQASSTHPVGGGAQPAKVQELFVRLELRESSSRSGVLRAAAPGPEAALAAVKERCQVMDGEARWQVDEQALLAALS